MKLTRGGSDEPLYGIEQRFSGCHEVFDEDGYEIGGVYFNISLLIFFVFY